MKRDPTLAYSARHNQVTFLIDDENFREAEKQLFLLRPLCTDAGGRLNLLRLRWEEGRIDLGLKRYSRAEALFQTLAPEFEAAHRPYDAAIISLQLAAALLAQGKSGEAFPVALKALKTFIELGIQREGLQAVILLRDAIKQQTATQEMIEEVAGFLRKLTVDPALRFEGRAWESFDPDPNLL